MTAKGTIPRVEEDGDWRGLLSMDGFYTEEISMAVAGSGYTASFSSWLL